jgi:hypothetical protein
MVDIIRVLQKMNMKNILQHSGKNVTCEKQACNCYYNCDNYPEHFLKFFRFKQCIHQVAKNKNGDYNTCQVGHIFITRNVLNTFRTYVIKSKGNHDHLNAFLQKQR